MFIVQSTVIIEWAVLDVYNYVNVITKRNAACYVMWGIVVSLH